MSSIWVYSNIRNEATLLPYWLRHYKTFAERIIVYDDESDDGSLELMLEAGVEVRPCPWSGLDDLIYPPFASQQYREARGEASWVVWVDGDEFLYHPNIAQRLDDLQMQGVTLPLVDGYTMLAEAYPSGSGQIYDEIRTGVFDERYSKACVLDPWIELQWGAGRHEFISNGVREPNSSDNLKLLHYRWFGREEYIKKNNSKVPRLSDVNLEYGLGVEALGPAYTGHHSVPWYEQLIRTAQPCI